MSLDLEHQNQIYIEPDFTIYPTRIEKIGGLTCFFHKSYKNGQFPVLNVGPSRIACFCLFGFAMVCLGYLILLVSSMTKTWQILFSLLLVFFNLFLFLRTMFGDQGISPETYLHHIQYQRGEKGDIENGQLSIIMKDKNYMPQR